MRRWFYSLDDRERTVVSLGLLSLLLITIYLFIIEPTGKAVEQLNHRLIARDAEYKQLQQIAQEYKSLDQADNKTVPKLDRSLLSLIDQSSQEAGIKQAIKRLTPEGDKKVRVHFEGAEFNRVIGWLVTNYQQQGVSVSGLTVRKTDEPGMISGTVMLVR